jgi:hypothetical protein
MCISNGDGICFPVINFKVLSKEVTGYGIYVLILIIKELRRDFTELARGVSAMDLQVQEIENEKLEKQNSKNKLRASLRKWSCSRNMTENITFLFMVLTTGIKMRTYMP